MSSLAYYYSCIADTVRALSLLDSALAMKPGIDRERYLNWQKGLLYAGSGNQEELQKLIDTLNMPAKQIGIITSWSVPNALKMELFRLQGNIKQVMMEFEKLDIFIYRLNIYTKAKLYGDASGWENVILTAKEMQASPYYFNFRSYNYPRAYYVRGKAYEELGKQELAIENYEALLKLWKNADEEISERRDTIKRLAALKQGS